ncbi:MAG: YidC/Oxa1 family membrane protein insertase [Eubacteriales bacterium]
MESIFDILYIPMGYLIRLAYSLTDNYLLAILLFTLIMEIILSPFGIKQQKNQVKQASLAPKVAAIRKKYAGRNDQATQQKMQEELMDMYKKENFNPAGGCGTLLIQFPIIICLYNVVVRPLRYISNIPTAEITALQSFLESAGMTIDPRNAQISIINFIRDDVANYYSIAPSLEGAVLPVFKVGPFDLSQIPEISFSPFNWLMLIPVLTFIVMILSQKITQKFTYQSPETEQTQNSASMKIMMWTMPLLSVYIEFQMSAAIGVYWIFRSILSTLERILFSKLFPVPKFTEEDYRAAERAANVKEKKAKKENKAPVRSLHHIDDEEYLERQRKKAEELEAEEQAERETMGDTTSAEDEKAAPIKNDDRAAYKRKSKKTENNDTSKTN